MGSIRHLAMPNNLKRDSFRPASEQETFPTDLGTCAITLVKAASKGVDEIVAPFDLSSLHFAVLRRFLHKDRWTSTELLQLIPVGAPRMSRLVAKLVDDRFLRRRRLRNDRRVVVLSLTDEGRRLTNDIDRRMRELEDVLTDGVTDDDMATFFRVTQRILTNEAARSHVQPVRRRPASRLDDLPAR